MNEIQTSALPFTVLGGFLGSGKTTLLNRLLNLTKETRYAVLVNDFGELNIDERLITAHDGETIALANGCMCCSMADGFVSALTTVMERGDQFDQMIVEASGVSNPGRIMDIAKLDAPQFLNQLKDSMIKDAVLTQVKEADILVINKAHLTDQSTVETIKETLDTQHSDCTTLVNDQPVFDPGPLFGSVDTANLKRKKNLALVDDKSTAEQNHDHTHDQFQSYVLHQIKPIDRSTFESWATTLPPSVIRGKGFISFAESPHQQWIWQKVGRTYDLESSSEASGQSSMVVLIGTKEMPVESDPVIYGPFLNQ